MTAANGLVKLLRLQQITSGWVRADESDQLVEVDTSKADALGELVNDIDADEPIVVFCRFTSDINAVERTAEKLGRPFGQLTGRANDLDENILPETIDDQPGYLFAVQIQSGGVGVDFTRSRYCVYYSVGYSLGDYRQSVARLHRPGQERSVHYYHIIAASTVDETIYETMVQRDEAVAEITGGDDHTLRKILENLR